MSNSQHSPRFITVAEAEQDISTGGSGLSEWNAEATYSTGAIKLWHNGLWESTVDDNTNSEPVSGNTDWTLVGGTPYLDLLVTPPERMTTPFYQESGVPGNDGAVLVPAPEAGKFVQWVAISAQTSNGDQFEDPGAHIYYQGLNDPDYTVNTIDDPGDFQFSQVDLSTVFNVPVNSAEGLPILIATSTAPSTQANSCSILYRVWYQIHDVVPTQFTDAGNYYSITAVDQGAKIFQLEGDQSSSIIPGAMQVIGSTANDGTYIITDSFYVATPQNITAVNQGAKKFTVAGDKTLFFPIGYGFTVAGSTGNDGTYTIDTVTFVTDHTEIVVLEAIPDSTADGTGVSFADVTDLVVSESIPDSTADGWINK